MKLKKLNTTPSNEMNNAIYSVLLKATKNTTYLDYFLILVEVHRLAETCGAMHNLWPTASTVVVIVTVNTDTRLRRHTFIAF